MKFIKVDAILEKETMVKVFEDGKQVERPQVKEELTTVVLNPENIAGVVPCAGGKNKCIVILVSGVEPLTVCHSLDSMFSILKENCKCKWLE